ncbi:DUF3237 family protein [Pseudobacteroides cellulosolvens]|uniref:Dockerin domain-containing protein n=1 Tax=Pseudobacteroides cellulosolvens ATCC 35603 = DSM 2933 TaxID=398512 RepID=A0A0L6JPT5_9FIRM|nr:DUF3237 family protein [Pseudobacteroides cellulosolvens]KNY27799.1 putative protein family UPF0311 [Pseudobacteroides cellulosolvens ATCC 35603 = DSM 2933]
MKNNRMYGLLFISFVVMTIITVSFIQCISTAAGTKTPDLNGDKVVNMADVILLAGAFNAVSGDGKYKAEYDLNVDNAINMADVIIIAGQFNTIISSTSTPTPTSPQQTSDNEKILIPHKSWTCGMADGIPKPESGSLVLEANMKLEQIYNLGKTQYGERQVFVIQSGTITSTKISGSIMSGGLDLQLELSNGAMEIEQLLMIKTSDGKYIFLRSAGTAANKNDIRIVPDFEAPSSGTYSWLNSGKYVARRVVDLSAKTMKISVYDVSGVTIKPDSTNSVIVTEPTDVQDQPWDYRKAISERNGSQFIVETVGIGASQSVGASKRGNRNVIPITGGSVTGKITAKILSAGADYQNLSNPMTIDARYLWQTNDGEIIIVRNGGQFGSLVPTFEVRADSKYSYLNNTLYLSSNPGTGAGSVTITFYESQK